MKSSEKSMDPVKKEALKTAKEIAVKFIETGRISPAAFAEVFPSIYAVVLASVSGEGLPSSGKIQADLMD